MRGLAFFVLFHSKDLWSRSGHNVEERSSVVGFSYQSKVCTNFKYAISEEIGGFLYINVNIEYPTNSANHLSSHSIFVFFYYNQIAAHEIAHSLGLGHDGDKDQISIECSSTENYIMTQTIGSNSNNLTNQLRFSNCSVNLLKSIYLNKDFE